MAATTKRTAAQRAAEEASKLSVPFVRKRPKHGRGEMIVRPGKR